MTITYAPVLASADRAAARPLGALPPVLVAATTTTGLIAGVYYSYAVSVMPGLARGDDHTFVTAMQNINVAIQNPVFFVAFLGAPALAGAAALMVRRRDGARALRRPVAIAFGLLALSIATTAAVNIPLNNTLDAAARSANPNYTAIRDHFESVWVAFNVVRGVLATSAFVLLGKALTKLRVSAE